MKWVGPRPASPPLVTFAQMQAQLRIDDNDEQQYIQDLVDAVTEYAELAMDMSLLNRTITATYFNQQMAPGWWTSTQTGTAMYLPRGPVQSITSIVDANSNTITDYTLQGFGNYDCLQINKPWISPVVVTYVAGHGPNVTDVPSDIRMLIRAHVASWWRTREAVSDREQLPVPHSLELAYSLRKRNPPVG